jgi:protein gp37
VTSIEWVRGPDGSPGISWNALRAVRKDTGRSAHHCEHVNEACRFCYAERMNARLGGLPFKPGHRKDYDFVVDKKKLLAPLRRKKPTRIFVESMSDAFGEWWSDEQIDQLYAVMALCPQHTFVNLTKRPERRREYLSQHDAALRWVKAGCQIAKIKSCYDFAAPETAASWSMNGLPNVIEGTSVSNQEEADAFIPILLQTRAALRCVSIEPMLGPVKLWRPHHQNCYIGGLQRPWLDWVICGGESGPSARPMHPQWARDIRDQCQAAGVPFFFKQWGEFLPWHHFQYTDDDPEQTKYRTMEWENGRWCDVGFPMWCDSKDGNVDEENCVGRVGKKAAGRLLDGREWNEFPDIAARKATGEAA